MAKKESAPSSKPSLLDLARQLDDLGDVLTFTKRCLDRNDPNRGRIDEARDHLEAAAGRLKCAI